MARGLLRIPDVDGFVEDYIDSFAAWDILCLYGTKPNRLSLPCDIAELVGRPTQLVEECLRSLAQKGFFKVERSTERCHYHWAPDPKLAARLKRFVSATTDRRLRLKALSILLRKLGPAGSRDHLQ